MSSVSRWTATPKPRTKTTPAAPLHLAIVGRPNAGKSTLVNRMLGEERMITGPEAGITRDSISIEWEWPSPSGEARKVRLVDTAGLRKRAKVDDKLERLSAADTRRSIDYAEVVVLLLDATRGLESQDLKIADQVIEEGRALIIALNKWDVAEHASSLFNGVKGALAEGLAQLKDVALLTVSGKTGKGIDTILQVAFELREAWSRRVTTGELNRWFEAAIEANPPPAPKGQRIKLRYITQVIEPAADLRGVRQPHRGAARKLPPLSGQCAAPRPQARGGADPAQLPRPRQSLRPQSLIAAAKAKFTV